MKKTLGATGVLLVALSAPALAQQKSLKIFYGAQSFDAALLVNSAVNAVAGDVAGKADMIKAMEKADFASVRGPFRYGNNHFPIQNFYLQDVVKRLTARSGSRPSPRSSRKIRTSSTTSV